MYGIMDQEKDTSGKTGKIQIRSTLSSQHCPSLGFPAVTNTPWTCNMVTFREAGGGLRQSSLYCLCDTSASSTIVLK